MEWKEWKGKEIFLRTKHNKVYSGKVISVNDNEPPLIWISILDKFGDYVMFATSEITEIKEEEEGGRKNTKV